MTRPFICRSEDGRLYVVKGKVGCGLEALRAEWVAGRCAQVLGLPIPPFAIVTVPEELVNGSAMAGIGELGVGQGFGSLFQEGAQEVSWTTSLAVSPDLAARILLFDWWIQNNDRMMTDLGGNPNLICSGESAAVNVIDHHAAFDREFDPVGLWGMHIFCRSRPRWDRAFEEKHSPQLVRAVEALEAVWKEIPDEWFTDGERTSGDNLLDAERVRTILMRPISAPDTFWSLAQ